MCPSAMNKICLAVHFSEKYSTYLQSPFTYAFIEGLCQSNSPPLVWVQNPRLRTNYLQTNRKYEIRWQCFPRNNVGFGKKIAFKDLNEWRGHPARDISAVHPSTDVSSKKRLVSEHRNIIPIDVAVPPRSISGCLHIELSLRLALQTANKETKIKAVS